MTSRRPVALLILACAAGLLLVEAAPATGGASAAASELVSGNEGSRSHNYDLADYRLLLLRARGSVAIARRSSRRSVASGVLIGEDLVLTCRHVTHVHSASARRRDPAELEVRLSADAADTEAPLRRFPVLAFAHTSERVDLCVLRIGPDGAGELPSRDRVQRLSDERVPLASPIYLIHHPRGGPLRVADDAYVLFPYEATGEELDLMTDRLRREVREPRAAADVIRRLRAGYRSGPRGTWLNHSLRWAGQPVLGADCLALDGSSGAPVYAKRTHALVGILFAGVDETRTRVPSTWRHHEAVLPAAAILEELRRSPDAACRALAVGPGR